VLASVDGELIDLVSPLHIVCRQGALITLMPESANGKSHPQETPDVAPP
jgi:hypothetical protein